jgi:hypothetical protein
MGVAVVSLLTMAALVPAVAAPRAERELLGIRIWNSYAHVLAKYGQPTRIESGLASGPGGAAGQATPNMGGAGMMAGGPGGPGMGSSMMAMMSRGMAPGGISGAPGMGAGNPYGRMGMGGGGAPGMAPGGISGAPGMGGGNPYGRMGMGGGVGPAGGSMGMPGMGMPGIGGAVQSTGTAEVYQTWVYERGPVTNYFVFNKDGRVVQIESTSLQGGGSAITSRTVRLGDPAAKVYKAYGWTSKVMQGGDSLMLDYTREAHAAFQVLDAKGRGPKVVSIVVTLLDANPSIISTGTGMMAASGMQGMMPGMAGMGMMSGRGMGMGMGRAGMGPGGMVGGMSAGKAAFMGRMQGGKAGGMAGE